MDEKMMKNEWEVARTINELTVLLDQKKLEDAMKIFSEDAEFKIIEDGKTILDIKGKEAIQDTITERMQRFDVLFHDNGTQVVDVVSLEQAATATTASIARLIQYDPASQISECLRYSDKLVKVNDFWYIVSHTIEIVQKSVQ